MYKVHFQVIKDEYYNGGLLQVLKQTVPGFFSVFDSEDGVYLILGEFGRYFIGNLDNEDITQRCFQFINYSIEQGGAETEDVIVLQIFHQIYEDDLIIAKVRPALSEQTLIVFENYLKKYNCIDSEE